MRRLRERASRVHRFGKALMTLAVGSVALATAIAYWLDRLGYLVILPMGGIAAAMLLGVLALPDRAWARLVGSDPLADDLGALHAEGAKLRSDLPWVSDEEDMCELDEWEKRATDWCSRVQQRLEGTPWLGTLLSPVGAARFSARGHTRASGLRNALDDKLERLGQIIASVAGRR